MRDFEPALVESTHASARELVWPDDLDVSFGGFELEAFAILERLREHPHIDQYRQEKPEIEQFIKQPFRHYRDDLVVNWVLPSRLNFETEKHVFSRLLKNDFGAGGCHYHKWMAFYRPGYRRLTDLQITHSLFPDGFRIGLFVGKYGDDLLQQAKERIAAQPVRFLELLNPLLEGQAWTFRYARGSGEREEKTQHSEPLSGVSKELDRADGIWLRRHIERDRVLALKSQLVEEALESVRVVWPLYSFLGREAAANE